MGNCSTKHQKVVPRAADLFEHEIIFEYDKRKETSLKEEDETVALTTTNSALKQEVLEIVAQIDRETRTDSNMASLLDHWLTVKYNSVNIGASVAKGSNCARCAKSVPIRVLRRKSSPDLGVYMDGTNFFVNEIYRTAK